MRTVEGSTHAICQFVGAEQTTVGLHHPSFAVDPLRLYRVEPRALFLGSKQGRMRTPRPLLLTCRLWEVIHSLTSSEVCQEALSRTRSHTFLPAASSLWQHHERNRLVLYRSAGDHPRSATTPPRTEASRAHSRRWPSDRGRLFRPTAGCETHGLTRFSPTSAQLLREGKASRLHRVSSSKPITQVVSGFSCARRISRSRRLFFSRTAGRGW
jgi:hypothetical protein